MAPGYACACASLSHCSLCLFKYFCSVFVCGCVCVVVCVHFSQSALSEVEVSSLFPPCRPWGLNSGPHVCVESLLPTEPRPLNSLRLLNSAGVGGGTESTGGGPTESTRSQVGRKLQSRAPTGAWYSIPAPCRGFPTVSCSYILICLGKEEYPQPHHHGRHWGGGLGEGGKTECHH